MGIDEVGIDKVGIDEVGRYPLYMHFLVRAGLCKCSYSHTHTPSVMYKMAFDLHSIICTWDQSCIPVTVFFPLGARGPSWRISAYEISKSTGFHVDFGFQIGFLDFTWISGFQSGFLDFTWISGFQSGFLDFKVDFWISRGFPDFKVDFYILDFV